MRLKVPQFIDIEDKTIGPLTLRQFLYLIAAGGVLLMLWFSLTLGVFIIVSIPVILFALAMAFYKFNGRPFVVFLEVFIGYLTKPKLYVWKKKHDQ